MWSLVAGDDYQTSTMDLTFSAATTESVTVVLIDNALSEGEESLTVNLAVNEASTTFTGTVSLSPNSSTVLIVDNDGEVATPT